MIKLDIKGAELKAIRGMSRLLQEYDADVICEVSGSSLRRCLLSERKAGVPTPSSDRRHRRYRLLTLPRQRLRSIRSRVRASMGARADRAINSVRSSSEVFFSELRRTTTDCEGLNLSNQTIILDASERLRTNVKPFQGWNTGSIPVGDANRIQYFAADPGRLRRRFGSLSGASVPGRSRSRTWSKQYGRVWWSSAGIAPLLPTSASLCGHFLLRWPAGSFGG